MVSKAQRKKKSKYVGFLSKSDLLCLEVLYQRKLKSNLKNGANYLQLFKFNKNNNVVFIECL